ncbi:MAG: hypothetical protein M9958_00465 [Chitinophagales bacterium]|nr:hypothetical protein [Chitinophagales bacterium]
MPKSSKRFTISDSGLNAQGFRMLTEGAILDDFRLNPVMLFNHQRPDGNSKDQILPIGYWEDLEIEGDKITGVPFFDDEDRFAMSIYSKVENGVLRMCSAGAEPKETSSDPSLIIAGQTKETVTKWVLKEASICDIGANPNSLAFVALYSQAGSSIQLSANLSNQIPELKHLTMPKPPIQLSDEELEKQKLNAGDPAKSLSDEDKDALILKLQSEIETMKEELRLASEQLRLSEEEKETEKVENLVNKAIGLKQITLSQKPYFVKLARQDYDATSKLLSTMKAAVTIKETLSDIAKDHEDSKILELSKKSYDELFKNGGLAYLKLHAEDVYKEKYKSKFGQYPKNI